MKIIFFPEYNAYFSKALAGIDISEYLGKGDARSPLQGKTVRAGADRRKRKRGDILFTRKREAVVVGVSERLVLMTVSALPDGANGMDNVTSGQVAAAGQDCLAGPQGTSLAYDGSAFRKDLQTARAVESAVNTAASAERTVCRIDDRLGILFSEVAGGKDKQGMIDSIFFKAHG